MNELSFGTQQLARRRCVTYRIQVLQRACFPAEAPSLRSKTQMSSHLYVRYKTAPHLTSPFACVPSSRRRLKFKEPAQIEHTYLGVCVCFVPALSRSRLLQNLKTHFAFPQGGVGGRGGERNTTATTVTSPRL